MDRELVSVLMVNYNRGDNNWREHQKCAGTDIYGFRVDYCR